MSSPLRKMFETVPSLEEQGVVLNYAPGVEILVARAGGSNKKFNRVITRLSKPHRRAIEAEILDEAIGNALLVDAYVTAIIKGWKGITKDLITHNSADAEEELPFTKENVASLLTEQPNLFTDIQKVAENMRAYRIEVLESEAKN